MDTGKNSIKNNIVFGSRVYGDFELAPNSQNQVSGTISANPQFVNYIRTGGGDYRVKNTSPAIDKGLTTYAPATDINGKARPLGAGIDAGAYENY